MIYISLKFTSILEVLLPPIELGLDRIDPRVQGRVSCRGSSLSIMIHVEVVPEKRMETVYW